MKIDARVHAVRTNGEHLSIELRGNASAAPVVAREQTMEISIPDTDTSRRTYHVGREVTITVEPKP